jgi:hypothetical protein
LGQYKANSLTHIGAVGMGTGVMIGSGIFALPGMWLNWPATGLPSPFWWRRYLSFSTPETYQ